MVKILILPSKIKHKEKMLLLFKKNHTVAPSQCSKATTL